MVPLLAVARFSERATPTSINHQDTELATTISFNLPKARRSTMRRGDQAGRGRHRHADQRPWLVPGHRTAAQQSQGQQAMLIGAALVVIYLVLGMLYESLVHPVTVLSTLPSAGVGAVLAARRGLERVQDITLPIALISTPARPL